MMAPGCDAEAFTPNRVIIAVMGVTGSGKSSLIKMLTGDQSILVGDSLVSATSEITPYSMRHDNTEFTLLDTPGFDDTCDSNDVVVQRILDWLARSSQTKTCLNGIIYLHRIVDMKVQGSARKSIRIFRALCGRDCMPNVVLATTFWDMVSEEVGSTRVAHLKESPDLWLTMIQAGASVERLDRSRQSALSILESIARKSKIIIEAQKEMIDGKVAACETSAYAEAAIELKRVRAEENAKLARERRYAQDELDLADWQREQALKRSEEDRKRVADEENNTFWGSIRDAAWVLAQTWIA